MLISQLVHLFQLAKVADRIINIIEYYIILHLFLHVIAFQFIKITDQSLYIPIIFFLNVVVDSDIHFRFEYIFMEVDYQSLFVTFDLIANKCLDIYSIYHFKCLLYNSFFNQVHLVPIAIAIAIIIFLCFFLFGIEISMNISS